MLLSWENIIIETIKPLSDNTKSYFCTVPNTSHFNFIAGQFITLDLPIADKLPQRMRSYSIASPPANNNALELCVVNMDDGLGSAYLANQATAGTELKFRGPAGQFTLPKNYELHDLVMICTGTGVAPFRSMIRDIVNKKLPYKSINLIMGARTANDLLYTNEFKELQSTLPNFNYVPVLSRENWGGNKGYVHEVYQNMISKLDAEAKFMLCGWRQMVDEAKQNLQDAGVDKKNIYFELYG